MKILVPGNKEKIENILADRLAKKNPKVQCSACDAQFTICADDVSSEHTWAGIHDPYVDCLYVNCPCCCTKVILNVSCIPDDYKPPLKLTDFGRSHTVMSANNMFPHHIPTDIWGLPKNPIDIPCGMCDTKNNLPDEHQTICGTITVGSDGSGSLDLTK